MTNIIPSLAPESSPKSELKVREALAPLDGLVLLHSVTWQWRRHGKQSDGEADFILFDPERGIAIIEVKGGGVEIIDGKWYSTDKESVRHSIKNPFEQAKDSKYALLGYLNARDKQLSGIPIIHSVIFPDIVVDDDETFGMYGHREIILDRADLNQPGTALNRLFKHWGKERQVSPSEIGRLLNLLAPTTTIRRLLSDEIADADKKLLQLTREQARVLQGIKRNRYAAIIGGAGTGKTILAVEKAKQLSLSGFRVLILCYNGPLRDHIERSIQTGEAEVHTFHSLVMREARKAKISVPASPPDEWFATDAAKVLSDAVLKNHTGFDAMLIDEAQDFAPTWIQASRSMLSDDEALLYVFADSHQDLYRRDWRIPDGFAEYELTVNCRNTRQIAEKVAKVFGDDLDGDLAEGPKPQYVEISRNEQLIPYVIQLIERLVIDENVQAAQIAVLADSRIMVDRLRAMAVADCMFADLNGNGIPVETVSRFKGLERDIVILAFTDQVTAMERSALIYVGLSRAKVGLYVIGSSVVRSWIGWDQ